jgi:hypothetical protein
MAKAEGYAGDAIAAPKIEPAAAEALARDGEQEDLAPLAATQWPERFKSIRRYKYESLDKFLAFFKDHASRGVPLIVEGTKVMDPEKWTNLDHLSKLLSGKPVLVKRSRSSAFRYYDMKKNSGNYSFEKPIQEFQKSLEEFLQDSEGIRREGLPDRMYLQKHFRVTRRWPKSLSHGIGSFSSVAVVNLAGAYLTPTSSSWACKGQRHLFILTSERICFSR